MSELGGLLVLVLGLGALVATGAFAACCLRLRSAAAFLLAAYLVAWAEVVVLSLALSPARWLTRGSLLVGLLVVLALALAGWLAVGRPSPPPFRPAFGSAAAALRDPAVLVLAVAVGLGALYVAALAFFTPSNDPDSLTYHLARAALWRQEHGLGHIAGVDDERVSFFPPNAEIGQLFTMLLASNDRYAALPQLLAYGALVVCVAGLARRLGLERREAVFAALAFATLPVVVLQASGTLNDLVVASFLAAAAYFALEPSPAGLVSFAAGVALAVGTKYTALIALPVLVLVAGVGQPPRRWPALGLAGLAGCAAGSIWFLVNLVEEGRADADIPGQRAELSPVPVATMSLRLLIAFVELPGAPWPRSLFFLAAAAALALLALRRGRAFAVAAAVTAAVVALPLVWELVVRVPYRLALLGEDDVVGRFSWTFNTRAEPIVSWYGPLGLVCLLAGGALAVLAWRRRELPSLALAFAAAPLALVVALALVLSWDLTRGRFVLLGVVLAAATWGLLLRYRALALAGAAIGATTLFLTLAAAEKKPSGLFGDQSIWGEPRWSAQSRIAGYGVNADVLRFVEERVPDDAHVALAFVGPRWISPFFGPSLSREVSIVDAKGGSPPADAGWFVLSPGSDVERCGESWAAAHESANEWRIDRRVSADTCLEEGS